MAFNNPQSGVLVNPLPFISGVQDPTVIPRAAQSYDMVAQGALQARAIGEPFSPKSNAETQAAIAEANVRRRTAQDEEINEAKKVITVAQGAMAKQAVEDLKWRQGTRGIEEEIRQGNLHRQLDAVRIANTPESAQAILGMFSLAGVDVPRDANGKVDQAASNLLIPELNAWREQQARARQMQSSDSLKWDTRKMTDNTGATIESPIQMNLVTGREWTDNDAREADRLRTQSFTSFMAERKKAAAGSTAAAPATPDAAYAAAYAATSGKTPPGTNSVLLTPEQKSWEFPPEAKGGKVAGVPQPLDPTVPKGFEGLKGLTWRNGVPYNADGKPVSVTMPGTKTEKAQTESMAKAGDYANRMSTAEAMYNYITADNFDPASLFTAIQSNPWYPNLARTGHNPEFQAVVGQFANAILRRDSGAAITADERKSYRDMFFPIMGDNPGTIALKKAQRESIMQTLDEESHGRPTALKGEVRDKIQKAMLIHMKANPNEPILNPWPGMTLDGPAGPKEQVKSSGAVKNPQTGLYEFYSNGQLQVYGPAPAGASQPTVLGKKP